MEKVLNQDEIDAMVRAARGRVTESIPAVKIKAWNFRQAGQIGREPLRAITQLHEAFARNLTHSLGAYLRVVFEVNLVSVEQLSYTEFLARLPELAYLATVRLQPVNAVAALQLDLSLALPIIDLLLGGAGAQQPELRDITEIEEQILEGVVRILCRELEGAWQPIGITTEFEQRQQPSQMQRLMPPSEKSLALSFEIRMSEGHGMLNIVLPSAASNILIRKLAHDWIYHRPRGLAECSPELLKRLLECRFEAELCLPPEPVPAQDLLRLKSGQVLALQQEIETPALVVVDGHGCFRADVVRHGTRRAGQIRDRLELQPTQRTV